jgi:hypothetical protein
MSKISDRKEFRVIIDKSINDCKKVILYSHNGIKAETEINQIESHVYSVYQSICVNFNLDYEYYLRNENYRLRVAFISDLINTVGNFLEEYRSKSSNITNQGNEYIEEIIECVNKFTKKPLYIIILEKIQSKIQKINFKFKKYA